MKRLTNLFFIFCSILIVLVLISCPTPSDDETEEQPKTYKLNVNISPNGTGSVSKKPDNSEYDEGTEVKLTAVANPGYKFYHWDGDAAGQSNPTTVLMDTNKTVTSVFVDENTQLYPLLLNIDPPGTGGIEKEPNLINYAENTQVILTAVKNPGFKFDHWVVGDATGEINPTTILMDATKDITAVFVKDPFTREKIIRASDNFNNYLLENNVSIYGDYYIVGAPSADSGSTEKCGQAYIFKRVGTDKWNEIDILSASDKSGPDQFGFSVSIFNDYAIVGAKYANSGDTESCGKAYIFKNNVSDKWNEIAIISSSDKSYMDHFGCSVSISGDYAIVGAGQASSRGRTYIFKNDGADNWNEIAILSASDETDGRFGNSVSIYGDYAIVGTFDGVIGGEHTGHAYIFKNYGADKWDEIEILAVSDQAGDHNFGSSVFISSDYSIVGADRATSDSEERSGQAYIFKNDGADNWNEIAILSASDKSAYDLFGSSVSLFGDYAIIGAPFSDSGGSNRGQAYVFKNDGADNWNEIRILKASDQTDKDWFGWSTSIYAEQAIVGAYYADSGVTDRGLAYIYY